MITAASVAWGRPSKNGVSQRIVTMSITNTTSPKSGLRTLLASATDRAREARVRGEALEEAGEHVAAAERDQLLVRVDLVAVAPRYRPGGADRLGVRDERQRQAAAEDDRQVAEADVRQAQEPAGSTGGC